DGQPQKGGRFSGRTKWYSILKVRVVVSQCAICRSRVSQGSPMVRRGTSNGGLLCCITHLIAQSHFFLTRIERSFLKGCKLGMSVWSSRLCLQSSAKYAPICWVMRSLSAKNQSTLWGHS